MQEHSLCNEGEALSVVSSCDFSRYRTLLLLNTGHEEGVTTTSHNNLMLRAKVSFQSILQSGLLLLHLLSLQHCMDNIVTEHTIRD